MDDYAIVGAGLLIGLTARWAVLLSLGQPLGWKEVRVDLLIIAMNGLLAATAGEQFGLHHLKLAVEAAMFGSSSTLVFSKLQRQFLLRTGTPTVVYAGPGEDVVVPPTPIVVEVHNVGKDSPQTTGEVAAQYLSTASGIPGGFDDLVRKLDEEK